MKTRIRYKQQVDGSYVTGPIQAGTTVVVCKYMPSAGVVTVKTVNDEQLAEFTAASGHKAKTLIKNYLKTVLKVPFNDEIRKKKA